ncbi:MAG: serine hydrolase, partial [Actinomycetota bacterium]|nr:serine hydrolase [Actinomycetota bacterium]
MGYLSTSRRVAFVAVALAFTLLPAAAPAGPGPDLTCAACYLVDDTGRVLFARAARDPRPNASTTKMITALVVRADTAGDEVVTVSATAAATTGGGLALEPGDRYTVDALLHALLMTSSNDAAVALAEHVAGNEAAFVAEMNRVSERMGADETHNVTAHGLDSSGHHASARDLAAFAATILADPVLARIVGTTRTSIAGPDGRELIENRNVLLEGYRGATGVKTGYTAGSGNVLVASARRGERTLIAVAMGSQDATADARRLLDHGWDALAHMSLIAAGAPVATLVF